MENLQYPIGKFEYGKTYTFAETKANIKHIEEFPHKLQALVDTLGEAQLKTPYREGGWNPIQVAHHLADSHMNACIRFKLALTEDNPTIKPYLEDKWATLPDYQNTPINIPLQLLQALHIRWASLLNSLTAQDFERTYVHPESKHTFKLSEVAALYAWHCAHHFGHIQIVAYAG